MYKYFRWQNYTTKKRNKKIVSTTVTSSRNGVYRITKKIMHFSAKNVAYTPQMRSGIYPVENMWYILHAKYVYVLHRKIEMVYSITKILYDFLKNIKCKLINCYIPHVRAVLTLKEDIYWYTLRGVCGLRPQQKKNLVFE